MIAARQVEMRSPLHRVRALLACALVLGGAIALLTPRPAAAQFSAAYELIKAVKDGDYAKVREEMLKCNCANARDADGDPLLVIAARNGDLAIAEFLLESGANPNAATRNDGLTAMMVFARADNAKGIALLAAHGADPNAVDKVGETALMQAVRTRRIRAIRALIESGADPTLTDYQGQSAIDMARHMRLRNVLGLLEQAQ